MKGKCFKISFLSSIYLLIQAFQNNLFAQDAMNIVNEVTFEKPVSKFMESEITNPLVVTLFVIIVVLAGLIAVMGRVVMMSVDEYKKKAMGSKIKTLSTLLMIGGLTTFSNVTSFAQEAVVEAAAQPDFFTFPANIGSISSGLFIALTGIILLELITIGILLTTFKTLFFSHKKKVKVAGEQTIHWIDKVNASVTSKGMTDEEASMGHDFDGIEELDNPTPPWWRLMFVISVIFGIVYIWRYEIAETAPGQIEELEIATIRAEIAKNEYLAKAANLIDENSVVMLGDASDLDAGKTIFIQMCAACHGEDGGGLVGPNLTDAYWIHGGKINDIFATIKYGVPEKGMKSWKDDYSPKQIAQLASYIKSIQGQQCATPKAPQGELYTETEVETTEVAVAE